MVLHSIRLRTTSTCSSKLRTSLSAMAKPSSESLEPRVKGGLRWGCHTEKIWHCLLIYKCKWATLTNTFDSIKNTHCSCCSITLAQCWPVCNIAVYSWFFCNRSWPTSSFQWKFQYYSRLLLFSCFSTNWIAYLELFVSKLTHL